MRFLIVGCGSMGQRRARCLGQLGYEDIAAVDPREDRRAAISGQSQVRVHANFDESLRDGADFALICVPPHHHATYLMRCIDARVLVFCEAPMTLTLEEAGAVIEAAETARVFVAPSCTYLHNPIHRRIKELIEAGTFGQPLAAVSHAGQHVADWHPYEDYRGFYASKRAEGGMGFDMLPHDLHLFTHLFGEVLSLSCMARRRAPDIDADAGAYDVYDVLLDMASGVSLTLHQDMFQRPCGVYRKIVCEHGVIEWNWHMLRTCVYTVPQFREEPAWHNEPLEGYDFETMYADELRHALDAFEGKVDYLMPPRKERRTLEVVLACEQSSRERRQINFAKP